MIATKREVEMLRADIRLLRDRIHHLEKELDKLSSSSRPLVEGYWTRHLVPMAYRPSGLEKIEAIEKFLGLEFSMDPGTPPQVVATKTKPGKA